jgi:hypothetical protein
MKRRSWKRYWLAKAKQRHPKEWLGHANSARLFRVPNCYWMLATTDGIKLPNAIALNLKRRVGVDDRLDGWLM